MCQLTNFLHICSGNIKSGSVLTSTVEAEACGSIVGHWVACNYYFIGMAPTIVGQAALEVVRVPSPDKWKVEVENWLEPTTMVVQNYSGDRLTVVRQIKVHLARSGFAIKAVIQVQKGAPAKLLLGTDTPSSIYQLTNPIPYRSLVCSCHVRLPILIINIVEVNKQYGESKDVS